MPVATVNPQDTVHFELKSLDGAFVVLRALPYGMKLQRRDKATRMKMNSEAGKGGRGAVTKQTIELETYSEWAMFYDFSYCIVDHNLQNPDETLIDFSKPMALKTLDPRVGSEIERYINDLNEEEDEMSIEDFLQPSPSPLETDSQVIPLDTPGTTESDT